MSTTGSTDSKSEKPMALIWGCELSSQRPSYTFQAPQEWHCEQQLALRTVCLGEKARDEFHVVEIVPPLPEDTPVPIATLKPSVLPMATLGGVELTPPVTFRLRAGSGPVYISGQHISLMPDLSWEEEEEEEEEDEGDEEEEPPKPQGAKRGNAAKKRRLEKEDEQNSAAPQEPLPSKGRGGRPGQEGSSRRSDPRFWHRRSWKPSDFGAPPPQKKNNNKGFGFAALAL
uniref:Nucleophosmin/nucleoplasmin 2 n=1 Tax=Anas platyrhynchos TaxID=8839 RepID=A0A8B9R8J3_ANAPL